MLDYLLTTTVLVPVYYDGDWEGQDKHSYESTEASNDLKTNVDPMMWSLIMTRYYFCKKSFFGWKVIEIKKITPKPQKLYFVQKNPLKIPILPDVIAPPARPRCEEPGHRIPLWWEPSDPTRSCPWRTTWLQRPSQRSRLN